MFESRITVKGQTTLPKPGFICREVVLEVA